MKIGPFTFTRDSALWLWGTIVAIVLGLATLDQATAVALGIPAAWLVKLRLAAFILGLISAKVSTSPFPHSKDVPSGRVDVSKLTPLVILALALGSVTSCASLGSARHRTALTVGSAHAVLTTIREGELLLVCGKPTAPAPPTCVDAARHKSISGKLVTAFDYDGKVAQLARDLPADASPSSLASLLGQIGVLVDDVLALIPDSSAKAALLTKAGIR
jgi:hypothetical protein